MFKILLNIVSYLVLSEGMQDGNEMEITLIWTLDWNPIFDRKPCNKDSYEASFGSVFSN